MRIQPFVIGPYGTCSYIVYDYDGKRCIFIDAPLPFGKPISFAEENGLVPEAVYLTHGHFDHIFGLAEIRREWPELPILIGKEDMTYIESGYRATVELLSSFDQFFLSRYAAAVLPDMPDNLSVYGTSTSLFEVIPTPGHTEGSVSLYSRKEGIIFTGDTLFKSGVGRTDIGGDQSKLISSLHYLSSLPPETLVFPGHGMTTDIGTETTSNPYLR